MSKNIPNELYTKVLEYFYNSDSWFYIKHPKLNYESPISWINSGKSLEVINKVLSEDTF